MIFVLAEVGDDLVVIYETEGTKVWLYCEANKFVSDSH